MSTDTVTSQQATTAWAVVAPFKRAHIEASGVFVHAGTPNYPDNLLRAFATVGAQDWAALRVLGSALGKEATRLAAEYPSAIVLRLNGPNWPNQADIFAAFRAQVSELAEPCFTPPAGAA